MEILTLNQMQKVKGGADAKKALDAYMIPTDTIPPKDKDK